MLVTIQDYGHESNVSKEIAEPDLPQHENLRDEVTDLLITINEYGKAYFEHQQEKLTRQKYSKVLNNSVSITAESFKQSSENIKEAI